MQAKGNPGKGVFAQFSDDQGHHCSIPPRVRGTFSRPIQSVSATPR
jgi:hypothetical protein